MTEESTAGVGHNSDTMQPATAKKLKAFVERIERLEGEKSALGEDIKEVYSEAKGDGFDAKVLRKVIALRKRERQEREAEAEAITLYMDAVEGIFS